MRNIDFKSALTYDYDTKYSCEKSGCDSICRCGVIKNERVTYVDFKLAVAEIYEQYFGHDLAAKRNNTINSVLYGITNEIDYYTIDRILRINKIYNGKCWDINVVSGYYGEEIGEVYLDESTSKTISSQLSESFDIDDISERIEYLLKLEYGYILPELIIRKYELITIKKSDIIFGDYKHHQKVLSKNTDYYSDSKYDLARGVVIRSGDKYRLVDGYHRCSSSLNNDVIVLNAY